MVDAAASMQKMGTLSKTDESWILGADGLRSVGKSLHIIELTEKASREEKLKFKMERLKAQDEIDITKPYAMGLLVADIFYSLSAAIEGDIY